MPAFGMVSKYRSLEAAWGEKQKRTIKDSGYWYGPVAASNRLYVQRPGEFRWTAVRKKTGSMERYGVHYSKPNTAGKNIFEG